MTAGCGRPLAAAMASRRDGLHHNGLRAPPGTFVVRRISILVLVRYPAHMATGSEIVVGSHWLQSVARGQFLRTPYVSLARISISIAYKHKHRPGLSVRWPCSDGSGVCVYSRSGSLYSVLCTLYCTLDDTCVSSDSTAEPPSAVQGASTSRITGTAATTETTAPYFLLGERCWRRGTAVLPSLGRLRLRLFLFLSLGLSHAKQGKQDMEYQPPCLPWKLHSCFVLSLSGRLWLSYLVCQWAQQTPAADSPHNPNPTIMECAARHEREAAAARPRDS